MAKIAASWVISPVMGGSIAAIFLLAIMKLMIDQRDILAAAKRFVPFLLSIMTWAFVSYLALKGLKKVIPVDFVTASLLGLAAAVTVFFLVRPRIALAARTLDNDREAIKGSSPVGGRIVR